MGQQAPAEEKMKESEEYYSYNLNGIIQEMKMLEMKILLHESDEAYRMMKQAEEACPEDAEGKKEESE